MNDVMVTRGMKLRSAVPDALVPGVASVRAALKLRDQSALALAREQMQFLIGEVAPDRVEAAARAYVKRDALRSELRYHPRRIAHQPVENVAALKKARAAGRGVVVSFVHHGHYEGATASLAAADEPLTIVVSSEMLAPDAPVFLRQHVRAGTSTGNRTMDVAEGSAAIKARLASRETLALASDVPGSTDVPFLGTTRRGSSGAARLAAAAGSLVVSLHAHCESDGALWLSLSDPVDPQDFADADQLLRHLVAAQEAPVLAWPEGYHHPTSRWGAAGRAS